MKYLLLILGFVILGGCSVSQTTTDRTIHHPEVTKTIVEQLDPDSGELVARTTVETTPAHEEINKTKSVSQQLLTEHGTSAETDVDSAKAGNKRQPKTAEEIRAEGEADFVFWMGLIGVGLMIFAALMLAAKLYLRATTGRLAEMVVSIPVWIIGLVGLIGAALFGWATLGAENQQMLAGLLIAGIVVVVWLSWRTSHKHIKASRNGEKTDGTT